MKITYFPDTDTAHLEFTERAVEETCEISDNVYIDLDAEGNLVAMTIEQAKSKGGLHAGVQYNEFPSG